MISRIAKINNDFLKYTLYRIYSLKSQLIIMIMCGVLSFPLIAFAASLQLHAENSYSYTNREGSFLIISMFLCGVAAVVFMLLVYTSGVNCYDYYNRRERVDLSWSLPIKSRDRFWGDFASGLIPLTLVYTISATVGLLIVKFGFPKNYFVTSSSTGEHIIPTFIAAIFAGLLTIFSVYILSVFCAAICGRVYETTAYPALIMAIIPALIALFGLMIFNNVWQIYIFDELKTVLGGTSPGGFLVVFFIELVSFGYWNDEVNLSEHLTFLNPAIIIPFVVINAGFLTSAFYLAKKRGAEKTGSAFAFKGALEIILALVVFCITSLFFVGIMNDNDGFDAGTVFGLIATTAIAFIILDVSAKRGFKKMGRAGIKYVCMLVGSVILSNILLTADGFGIGKRIPKLDDIESVSLDVQHLDSVWFPQYFYDPTGYFGNNEFKDRENIELLRELHVESNENPRNYELPNMRGSYWESTAYGDALKMQQPFIYTLKNGDTFTRDVRLNVGQLERLLPVLLSDEYKSFHINQIDDWLKKYPNANATARFSDVTGDGKTIEGRNAAADVMRLYQAFKTDYLAETFEQRFMSTERVLGYLMINFDEPVMSPDGTRINYHHRTWVNFNVLAHYTNLIAELERQGFDLSGELPEDWTLQYGITLYKSEYVGANEATSAMNWWAWGGSNDYQHISDDFATEEMLELIKVLYNVMQPSLLVQSEGYLLNFPNRYMGNFVIPSDYNHVAQRLHTLARIAEREWQKEQGWLVDEYKGVYYEDDYYYEDDDYYEDDYYVA
ncbi:MAG: hypothetical protein FWD48_09120 [Oscillospiraceae bacterium]|nr:hypothetical protein [Oscillospiraceae bacterium]